MASFVLDTRWIFDAPLERVWALISDGLGYPRWWPAFERAEARDDGVHYRVRGDLGLRLDFVQRTHRLLPPTHWQSRVSGDLIGAGTWELSESGGRTRVSFVWEVDLGRPVLRCLSRWSPVAWFMRRSHHRVMEQGRRALEGLLR
jgi:uncharacterized protein YndB with AHSA1/START domain